MAVHLNITLDADLVRRLRAKVPPKGLSAFIASALHSRLGPSPQDLDEAYRAAARESWRKRLTDEWSSTDTESWPE